MRIQAVCIIVLTFIMSTLFGLRGMAFAQDIDLRAPSQPIPASAQKKAWETDGAIQYKRGSYNVSIIHDKTSTRRSPAIQLSVVDERNGYKLNYRGTCIRGGGQQRLRLSTPVNEERIQGAPLNIYFETGDFSALKIGGLIKVAQEALVDQCPRVKEIVVLSNLRQYRSSAGIPNVGSMSADNDWVFRVARLPITIEIGDQTKVVETVADDQNYVGANGISVYEYRGYVRQAQVVLSTYCDRKVEISITELAHDQRADTNYNAYPGDIGAGDFPLKPLIDATRMLVEQKCPQLETAEIKVSWRNATGIYGERYLYVHSSSDWHIVDGTGSECRTLPYAPPAGEAGLLPTNDLCPNYYLTTNGVEITPQKDWSIYVRNRPVVYGLKRGGFDNSIIMTVSNLGACPSGQVDMDLLISPPDFGGKAGAVENIRSILAERNFNDPLNRFVYRFIGQYNFCHEESPGQSLPHFKYRVASKSDRSETLGVIDFFHLGERASDQQGAPFVVSDSHPIIVKRRELMRKIDGLTSNGLFAGYPGGLYLSAIYAGEFEVARELDQRSGAGAEAFVGKNKVAEQFAKIQALFSFQPGREQEFREAYEVVLSEYTLSHSAMATYVLSFGEIYESCLGADPVGKKVTRKVQEVLSDGTGFEIPIGATQISERDYWVKRDLGYMLNFYGDEEGLAISGLVDNLFTRGSELTANSINSGVLQAMRRFNCSSPEMIRFDENLRQFWIDRHDRLKPYTDKLNLGVD